MYRPESGIAEEFIDDQEIKDTLAYADANKDNKELILSIIEKAKKLKRYFPQRSFRTSCM